AHRADRRHARPDRRAVEVDGACATLGEPAPELRPGEPEVVPEDVEERRIGIADLDVPPRPVDLERQLRHRTSLRPACATVTVSTGLARPTRQPARRRTRSASSLMSSSTLKTTDTRGMGRPKSANRNAVRARMLTRGPSKAAVASQLTGRVTSF